MGKKCIVYAQIKRHPLFLFVGEHLESYKRVKRAGRVRNTEGGKEQSLNYKSITITTGKPTTDPTQANTHAHDAHSRTQPDISYPV